MIVLLNPYYPIIMFISSIVPNLMQELLSGPHFSVTKMVIETLEHFPTGQRLRLVATILL